MIRRLRFRSFRRRAAIAVVATLGMAWGAVSSTAMRDAAAQGIVERPIRLVVGLPAGSGGDLAARVLADAMERELGQRVLVENRPGADGIIAVRHVASAPPDGTTLLFGLSSQFAVNPAIYANLPYDPTRDVVPVSQVAFQRILLTVTASLPVRSALELAAYSRERPGTINYSAGTSTFMLMAESFKQSTGADMLHVPFAGSSAAVLAVVAGTVQASFSVSSDAVTHVKAGRLRLLAVSGATRLRAFPDAPTFAELGVRDDVSVWSAVFAPAGTPSPIVQRLHAVVVNAIATPAARERLEAMVQEPTTSSPEELAAMIVRDRDRAQAIAKRAGIVPR